MKDKKYLLRWLLRDYPRASQELTQLKIYENPQKEQGELI